MRLQPARISAVLAACALAAGLAGCGGGGNDLPLRTISIQVSETGPLKSRSADIRRAAELELEAINSHTTGSRLELAVGPNPQALATINALARVGVAGRDQLTITLTPPILRRTRAARSAYPQIWLLPPDSLTAAARASYAASGLPGSRTAREDSPLFMGTPNVRQYITPALSADNYPPAGQEFFKKFEEKYGRAPDRYAIYGYEAVGLIVDALTRLEDEGAVVTPAALAKSALSIRNRFSPVGHYDVLPSGQSTLHLFQARGNGAPPGDAALIEALR